MNLSLKPSTRSRVEPIRLLSRRHNYFPQRFLWRGVQYDIYAVVRAWTEIKRGGTLIRHFFRVKCLEGTFDLYQDVTLNAWYMARRL
ncbi:MAG: hypothetical protein RBT47_05730 [Anaerolineae bacterium]|jgi:hypothetical protein|nr:hypothetical protein [Anaerolineae bacterium]